MTKDDCQIIEAEVNRFLAGEATYCVSLAAEGLRLESNGEEIVFTMQDIAQMIISEILITAMKTEEKVKA